MTGFFLTVSVDSILLLAKYSVEHYKTFSINLSAPFLIQFFGDQLSSVILYADIVFGNESEAEAYGAAHGKQHLYMQTVYMRVCFLCILLHNMCVYVYNVYDLNLTPTHVSNPPIFYNPTYRLRYRLIYHRTQTRRST